MQYPTSLVNLVFEVGTRHSHQILLVAQYDVNVAICSYSFIYCNIDMKYALVTQTTFLKTGNIFVYAPSQWETTL